MAIRKLQRKLYEGAGSHELLEMGDMVRLTKMGETTIRGLIRSGQFPVPLRLPNGSPRWTVGQYREWIAGLDLAELADPPSPEVREAA